MKRQRGFTLVEIMVALGLSAVVSAGMLLLAHSQLAAQSMNEEIMRAQGNMRAGMDYLETIARRACGGVSTGEIGLNVPGITPKIIGCVQVYDGATVVTANPSFTAGTTSQQANTPDAIEVVYPISTPSPMVIASTSLGGTPPMVRVADGTGYLANDLLLVTDAAGTAGLLFKVQAVAPVAGSLAADLTLFSWSGTLKQPTVTTVDATGTAFRARSVSIYLDPAKGDVTHGYMLMVDPDGVAGVNHTNAQPLVDGAVDLQVAVGLDTDANGRIDEGTLDEWRGNATGELPMPAPPWNNAALVPRLLRLSLLTQTTNTYVGASSQFAGSILTQLEDRTTYATGTAGGAPRYRAERISVAPRAWILNN